MVMGFASSRLVKRTEANGKHQPEFRDYFAAASTARKKLDLTGFAANPQPVKLSKRFGEALRLPGAELSDHLDRGDARIGDNDLFCGVAVHHRDGLAERLVVEMDHAGPPGCDVLVL